MSDRAGTDPVSQVCLHKLSLILNVPESTVEQKLRSTGQADQLVLWDAVHQFADLFNLFKKANEKS